MLRWAVLGHLILPEELVCMYKLLLRGLARHTAS